MSEGNESSSLFGDSEDLYYDRFLFERVPGLYLFRQALDYNEQKLLLDGLLLENRFPNLIAKEENSISSDSYDFTKVSCNQSVNFGKLPSYLDSVLTQLFEKDGDALLPSEFLDRRPLFDQVFFNLYLPGEGIRPHTDLKQFEDCILGISLLSATTMIFHSIIGDKIDLGYHEPEKLGDSIEVRIESGDIYVMTGKARHNFAHSIKEVKQDIAGGEVLPRKPRISLTLRKIKELGPF